MKYNLFLVLISAIFLVADSYVIFSILRLKHKIKRLRKFRIIPEILASCATYIDEVKDEG